MLALAACFGSCTAAVECHRLTPAAAVLCAAGWWGVLCIAVDMLRHVAGCCAAGAVTQLHSWCRPGELFSCAPILGSSQAVPALWLCSGGCVRVAPGAAVLDRSVLCGCLTHLTMCKAGFVAGLRALPLCADHPLVWQLSCVHSYVDVCARQRILSQLEGRPVDRVA